MSSELTDYERLQEEIRQQLMSYVFPREHAVPVSSWLAKDVMATVQPVIEARDQALFWAHLGHGTPCEVDPLSGSCGGGRG